MTHHPLNMKYTGMSMQYELSNFHCIIRLKKSKIMSKIYENIIHFKLVFHKLDKIGYFYFFKNVSIISVQWRFWLPGIRAYNHYTYLNITNVIFYIQKSTQYQWIRSIKVVYKFTRHVINLHSDIHSRSKTFILYTYIIIQILKLRPVQLYHKK